MYDDDLELLLTSGIGLDQVDDFDSSWWNASHNTARQDSLTRNINSVLGDPSLVTEYLFKEPSFLLGTSRSSQGPPTPAPAHSQDDSSYYSNLNQQKPSSTQKIHSSYQKRASTTSSYSSNYNHGSKQGGPPPTHPSSHSHRNPPPSNSHNFNKSRDENPNRNHVSPRQTHEGFVRHRQSNPPHFSSNSKPPKSEQTHKSGPMPSTFNSSHLPIVQKSPRLPHHSEDKATLGLKVELPAGVSERDRVSSVDSDMIGGVETIFKEMVGEQVEALTEIKTPSVGDSNFSFMTSKRKPAGPESSLESSNTDAVEGDQSDSDSTEDDCSDEDEEVENNRPVGKMDWNLASWTTTQQNPPNPAPGPPSKTPRESPSAYSRRTEEKSRSQDWPKQTQKQGVNPGDPKVHDGQLSGRGRRPDRKGSGSKNSSRAHSSSSSSQRSPSPGQRSASTGQRSSHMRSGPTAAALNSNQFDNSHNATPWSSSRDSGYPAVEADMGGRKQRHGSSSGQERTTKSPGSGRQPPSVRGSPPHHSLSKSGHHHSSHPHRHSPETQQSRTLNHSGVSKETVSHTHQGFEQRHKVGRKGPSHRITKDPAPVVPAMSSTGLSDCSSSSDSEASDDDGDVTIRNPPQPITTPPAPIPPINAPDSDSPSESSSGSESESSSSSDSDSDNEGDPNVPHFEDPAPQPQQVSWNLRDLGGESKRKTPAEISKRSPKSESAPRKAPSSTFHVSKSPPSPKLDQNTSSVTVQPPREIPPSRDQPRTQSNKKRKSAPGALTPNPCDVKPHITKQSPRPSSKSPRSQNNSWGGTSTTPSTVTPNQSTHVAKKARKSSASSDKNLRYHSSPRRAKGPNTVNDNTMSPSNQNTSAPTPPRDSYPPLWVSIKAMLLRKESTNPAPTHKRPVSSPLNENYPPQRCPTTVSTGSETEQPVRRADNVQVAVADGSTDWDANVSSAKRKMNSEPHYEDNPRSMQSLSNSNKRIKRDKAGSNQTSPAGNTSSPWLPERTQRKKTPPDDLWRDHSSGGGFSEQTVGHQRTRHPNHPDGYHSNRTPSHPHNADSYHNNRTPNHPPVNNRPPNSRTQARQESPTSNNPSCQPPVLPDSSVPEQEKEIQTSDWYMREGQRMKHEGDGLANSRTGRTRPGEALSRALAYFEASLFFIMSGYVMEAENFAERSETGSNSGSSSTSHSPTNMYKQTVHLLDFVLKMRPHVEQDDMVFKRIMISCIRCQALLYFRIFKLKKDIVTKYSDLLNDQFKNIMSKSNRTPSPWDHNANTAPNVLSPMSPAVPSPFGHPGPSPVSSNGEQVSSSTQAGKMTPPSHNNLVLPQKTYDMYRQYHAIMRNLLLAHEKWDQGETMVEAHTDFFRNIDTLCNRTLTFHTSLRDVFQYHKVVLYQLRTITTNSPHE